MIAVILGTRPEIIKMSPILRLLRRQRKPYFLLHTGQHYSYEMDKRFFEDLDLPTPHESLSISRFKASGHGEQTALMMRGIETAFLKRKPRVVLVQGDTNTVLAGSLVTAKLPGMKLGHVEAGLRSYDRCMPEEINRIASDHVSDFLFVPTRAAKTTLLSEGVSAKKIHVTGNTIVDAVFENLQIAKKKVKLKRWGLPGDGSYLLVTLHRQENVDHKARLQSILRGIEKTALHFKKTVLFPVHPRTQKRLKEFGLKLPSMIQAVEPVGFLEFLRLEAGAALLLSDSGGVQEEGCILKVPCVTLRTSTERPETVTAGGNVIAGYEADTILRLARRMMHVPRRWANPFGDGRTAERIIRISEQGS